MHILPSANDVRFDDRRQARWTDMSETAVLVDRAFEARTSYLAGLGP